jgi:hypothetical protein
MIVEKSKTMTEMKFDVEGYAFGFQPHEDMLADMTIHEDDLVACISDYLMDDLEYAEEMTEGQDYDIEDYPPKKVKVTVQITLEEI